MARRAARPPKPGIAAGGERVSVLAQNGAVAVQWCVFDAADGQRRWCDAGGQQLAETLDLDPEGLSEGQFGLGVGGIGINMPKVAAGDDGLFVTAPTGQLVAVEPDEPVARWSVEYGRLSGFVAGRVPWVVADEHGPITEVNGKLAAFDAASGQRRWQTDVGKLPQSLVGLAVADGVVYVASAQAFHAVDADRGEIRWSTPLEGARTSQPVVDGEPSTSPSPTTTSAASPGTPFPGGCTPSTSTPASRPGTSPWQ